MSYVHCLQTEKSDMALAAGTKAPDFTLPSTTGKDFTLSIEKKSKPLILYFYPADFTSGCVNQACGYRDTYDMFKSYEIDVIGISKDDIATHIEFKKIYNLPFELLSDPTHKVSKLYDVHVPLINFTRRTTFLLDRSHTIVASYENIFLAKMHITEMVKQVKAGKVSV